MAKESFGKGKTRVLHTLLGVRTLYDSVSYCNRCAMCAAVCPAYQRTPQEDSSPRGRNQALRLLLEGKIKIRPNQQKLNKLVFSCSLCGKCTQVCPGKIPTAQHMLELRRRLKLSVLPRPLFVLLRWREDSPRLFYWLVKMGLVGRHIGLLTLAAYLPGFYWLSHLQEILPARIGKPFRAPEEKHPSAIYLPSLEAEFLMPHLAKNVYQTASQKYRVAVWKNAPSGLFEYVYGDLQRARRLVRQLITRHRHFCGGDLPLITDSIDVYALLKRAPELFEGFASWQQKAQRFAGFVEFSLPPASTVQTTDKRVMLMPACVLGLPAAFTEPLTKTLRILFKENFVQCEYREPQLAPLGYSFIRNTDAHEYNLQAVRTVASYQAQTVLVLSGLSMLEWGYWLKKYYPAAQARHIVFSNG